MNHYFENIALANLLLCIVYHALGDSLLEIVRVVDFASTCLFHSDRDLYGSYPNDNAKAESFFKTLKHKEVYLKEYESFADAQANLEEFIERVYNTKRLHSSLGYRTPVEFEASYEAIHSPYPQAKKS